MIVYILQIYILIRYGINCRNLDFFDHGDIIYYHNGELIICHILIKIILKSKQ